jgi:hypothetical protein
MSDASRPLTANERIELRHHLQELAEHALSVRNAMDPLTGMHTITVAAWRSQLNALTASLETVTRRQGGAGS